MATRRVNLRKAYEASGYKMPYSKFIRDKVVPVIGKSALKRIRNTSGRAREYTVTRRNFTKVTVSLGIDDKLIKLRSIKKRVESIGPDLTAEMILALLEKTTQPTPSEDYPINFKVPLHPISHNNLYSPVRSRLVRSGAYTSWRIDFFNLMEAIQPSGGDSVDFSKPLGVKLKFHHRRASDPGHIFDMQNFAKAAIDCAFEYFGEDDKMVEELSMTRELVNEYSDGSIEISIRNL